MTTPEMELDIIALQRRVMELEYQLEACRVVLGIDTIPSAPPQLFRSPTGNSVPSGRQTS